jgi:hypothetical protein
MSYFQKQGFGSKNLAFEETRSTSYGHRYEMALWWMMHQTWKNNQQKFELDRIKTLCRVKKIRKSWISERVAGRSPIRLSPTGHSPVAKVPGCIGESTMDFRQLARFQGMYWRKYGGLSPLVKVLLAKVLLVKFRYPFRTLSNIGTDFFPQKHLLLYMIRCSSTSWFRISP